MARRWKASFDATELLKTAFKNKDLDTAIAALKYGADPYTVDSKGVELIHRFAEAGELDLVKLMLSKGYDVNAPSKKLGWSLLMTSLDWYFVDEILELGAHPDFRSPKHPGDTALTLACGSGGARPSHKMVQRLLRAGANPNLARADGWTPLMIAAENNERHIAYALLQAGADPNRAKGRALEIAQQRSHSRVEHYIRVFLREKTSVALTLRLGASIAAIRMWLARQGVRAQLKMVRAKKTHLKQLTSAIGRPLTDELHALLTLVGGSDGSARLLGFRSLSVPSIIARWNAKLRKTRLVPFAEDTSDNLLCVDVSSDDGAISGPVVRWDVRGRSARQVAKSLEAYLEGVRTDLNRGKYRYAADLDAFVLAPPSKRTRPPIEEEVAELIRLRPEFQKLLSASRVVDFLIARVQLQQLGGEGGPKLPPLSAARKKEIASIPRKKVSWKLAVAWPMTPKELAAEVRRHRRPGPPFDDLWQRSDLGGLSCACRRDGSIKHANFDRRDLRGLSFKGLQLGGAQFNAAIADNVDFSGARLDHALLTELRAPGACFDGAKIHKADFSQSNLRGASFKNAYLRGADFEDCDLTGCDFTGATLTGVQNVPARFASRVRTT